MISASRKQQTSTTIKLNRDVVSTHDVIIVGGGLSGLTTATELDKKGYDVLVLEAQERVGGRLHTIQVEGINVDVGGQWVGPTQYSVIELIEELGIETFKQFNEGKSVCMAAAKNGQMQVKSYDGIIPAIGWLSLIDLQLVMWDADKKAKTVPLERPWECPDAKIWDSMTVQTYMDKSFWTNEAKLLFNNFVDVVYAADAAEISFLFFLWYIRTAGGVTPLIETVDGAQDARIRGGAQSLPLELAKRLGMNKIRLNSPVSVIDQSSENDNEFVYITTKNGDTYACKRVVVAMPPTMSTRIQYVPALPGIRDQLCQHMPLGSVIKTTMLFKSRWWRDRGYVGFFTNTTPIEMEYPVAAGFDLTEHPGIVGFINANRAKYWGQRTSDERKQAVIKQYADLFGVSVEFVESEFVYFAEKDWSQQEYNRGAYESFTTPGALTTMGPALFKPIKKIHWGGTETATEWNGYMSGAIQAGRRVAIEVHNLLSK